jgi:rhodanese-related sulfurtransferase
MAIDWEISPAEVAELRRTGESPLVLVDVRTAGEWGVARIDGAEHVPMDEIPGQLPKLEGWADAARLVIVCHHGVRSMNVTVWLRQQGLMNCQSMSGGIEQWSLEVDAGVPRY